MRMLFALFKCETTKLMHFWAHPFFFFLLLLRIVHSSFIFFSMAKHKAIKEQMAKEGGTGKVIPCLCKELCCNPMHKSQNLTKNTLFVFIFLPHTKKNF